MRNLTQRLLGAFFAALLAISTLANGAAAQQPQIEEIGRIGNWKVHYASNGQIKFCGASQFLSGPQIWLHFDRKSDEARAIFSLYSGGAPALAEQRSLSVQAVFVTGSGERAVSGNGFPLSTTAFNGAAVIVTDEILMLLREASEVSFRYEGFQSPPARLDDGADVVRAVDQCAAERF